MTKHFDLLVIGAGSGGLAIAQKAASYGAKVALIEKSLIGGTCVNRGCVPKKMLWYAGEIAEAYRFGRAYGFESGEAKLDFKELVTRREQYINVLNQSYEKQLKNKKITYLEGCASFVDSQTIKVKEQVYTAEHFVIATGCYPKKPELKGAEYALTSDDFFNLKKLPQKIAVIGGGYIAVELASILNRLGSSVSFLLRYDKPLRHFDSALGTSLVEIMQSQGVQLLPHHRVMQIEQDEEKRLSLYCQANKIIKHFDAVLFAIGRSPQTADLNLAAAGVKVDSLGFIETDKWERTNISHIYALGDVTGKKLLTPVAIAAGRYLAERIFGHKKNAYLVYEQIPTVIFNHPPIGSVGLSEEEAIEKYGKKQIIIYKTQFNSLFYATSEEKTPTMIKLITLKPSEKILGCHLIGRGADEILQGFAVAIKMGATKKDFDATLAIHPTTAEELVTFKN